MPPELTPCPCDTCKRADNSSCRLDKCTKWKRWFLPQWRIQCDELLRHVPQKEMPAPADTEREQQ